MSKLAGAAIVVITALVTAGAVVSGQTAAPAQNPDVLQALLREVRQLRLALESAAATQATIHLVVQRANVQEERLWRISREVETVRDELDKVSSNGERLASEIKRREEDLENIVDPSMRKEIEASLGHSKREAADMKRQEQALRQRDGGLSQTLNAEEARWGELNQRLDDLERLLTQPKR